MNNPHTIVCQANRHKSILNSLKVELEGLTKPFDPTRFLDTPQNRAIEWEGRAIGVKTRMVSLLQCPGCVLELSMKLKD